MAAAVSMSPAQQCSTTSHTDGISKDYSNAVHTLTRQSMGLRKIKNSFSLHLQRSMMQFVQRNPSSFICICMRQQINTKRCDEHHF